MSTPAIPQDFALWAHSANGRGERHRLVDHLRGTGELARRFASPFGTGELAFALGLLHDAGKADPGWQQRLLAVEGKKGKVGGDHWSLGARLLHPRIGAAALALLGHHRGLTCVDQVTKAVERDPKTHETSAEAHLLTALPELTAMMQGDSLLPLPWRTNALLAEMGVRMTFSALVDADHLDTGAHFAELDEPQVRDPVDFRVLVSRFETERSAMLATRPASPVDGLRTEVYRAAIDAAVWPPGLYRLPAPTGCGKTLTSAAFALHHAARYRKSRVIVAVPFLTITTQNAEVYRNLLGAENLVEHHSNVEIDERQARLGAENWDAPFVVTTTVQLFDSLFGRKPARSRKLHRLADAVIVLDEVQSLPMPLLVPILDGLRLLVDHFGATVLLASATQPAFEELAVWRERDIPNIVPNPARLYEQLKRVEYEWRTDPRPTLNDVASRLASERQALAVVNTTADARNLFRQVKATAPDAPVLHLSTRMYPGHRATVLTEVTRRLAADEPVILISTQLVESGVDLDFPTVYRAFAPAECLQQAAGRANREGRRTRPGRVVVFDPADGGRPPTYDLPCTKTALYFGPGKACPDDLDVLASYYGDVYAASNTDNALRGRTIQGNRERLDYTAVVDGPLKNAGDSIGRNHALAFRMVEDDLVPVVVTRWPLDSPAGSLVDELRREPRREIFRALQPYIVGLPHYVVTGPESSCVKVLEHGDLYQWCGDYDDAYGIDVTARPSMVF